jgi:hypothetical protein
MLLLFLFFIYFWFVFCYLNYIILNPSIQYFFRSTENSHVSTNLVHTLYRMQSIGTMPLTSFKKQLDPRSYKRCEEKSVETWYSLTRPIFLDYMYSVSISSISYYVFNVYLSFIYITSICTYQF